MRKKVFDTLKSEFQYMGLLFLLALIVFKAVFFKEDAWVVFRSVLSIFWLFVLPGYFIMLYWRERLGFVERIVVGIALSAGVIGIFSYYFGIIGLNIKYHAVLLPVVITIAGLVAAITKNSGRTED